jgi:uncharacterized MnhB-related membrane protein
VFQGTRKIPQSPRITRPRRPAVSSESEAAGLYTLWKRSGFWNLTPNGSSQDVKQIKHRLGESGGRMNYWILDKKVLRKRIVVAAAVLMALRLYIAQQLLAAFFIFSALSACIAVVVLILFLLDHAWQVGFTRAEAYIRAIGRPAGTSRGPAEGVAIRRRYQSLHGHRHNPA